MAVAHRSISHLASAVAHTLLVVVTALFFSTSVHADNPNNAAHSVKLSIRTIQASEPRGSGEPDESGRRLRLDPPIGDLHEKLAQLPFGKFQLLSSKEETITLRKKNSIKLPNGQSLAFRPLATDKKKMGLWLHWREKDGSEILNTRLHFDSNDSVLTGTDCAHDKGLILAIKAEPLN